MPSRNYACITEVDSAPENRSGATLLPNGTNGVHTGEADRDGERFLGHDGHSTLHEGEEGAGTQHPAADGVSSRSGMIGGLNVSLRVEIDNKDRAGATEGYGFSSEFGAFFP